MSLSDFEIGKIAEIVAGKVGTNLDAKTLRRVIDTVIDGLQNNKGNIDIEGATCEVTSRTPLSNQPEGPYSKVEQASLDQANPQEGGLYEKIEKTGKTRIIIAAFGKDRPGVVASITSILAEMNCSIEDVSQTLMQEFFSMIMVVNITDSNVDFGGLRDRIKATEDQLGMKVYVMHEDIFQYMHRI